MERCWFSSRPRGRFCPSRLQPFSTWWMEEHPLKCFHAKGDELTKSLAIWNAWKYTPQNKHGSPENRPFFQRRFRIWFHHHFQVPAVNFWGCNQLPSIKKIAWLWGPPGSTKNHLPDCEWTEFKWPIYPCFFDQWQRFFFNKPTERCLCFHSDFGLFGCVKEYEYSLIFYIIL